MSTTTIQAVLPPPGLRHLGMSAVLAAAWSLAGGVAAGLLVTLLFLTERLHPLGLMPVTLPVAVVGAMLGAVHGAVLGWVGGHTGELPQVSWWRRLRGVVLTLLSFTLAVLLAFWLVTSAALAKTGSATGWMGLAAGLIASAVILVWATYLGWRVTEHAYHQWADRRLGSWLLAGTFVVASATLLGLRPVIPGTGLQLSALGSVAIGAAAAIWIAAPAIVLALRLAHTQTKWR
jgi:hypothetical protein